MYSTDVRIQENIKYFMVNNICFNELQNLISFFFYFILFLKLSKSNQR